MLELIKKVVIPVAGRGTRLLPTSKEQPKEMLPIFYHSPTNQLTLKPMVQCIFEQLYEIGLREFCFITGSHKRSIEKHFTPDYKELDLLESKGTVIAKDLKQFYEKIEKSSLVYVNQDEPLGYGHAVYLSKSFVGEDKFLLHAGDTMALSKEDNHLKDCLESNADGMLMTKYVEDPQNYGVVTGKKMEGFLKVESAVEKPKDPISNLAIMAINTFNNGIFDALSRVKPGVGNEIQLTDGIQIMINENKNVLASELPKSSLLIDIGTPEKFFDAQKKTYEFFRNENNKTE